MSAPDTAPLDLDRIRIGAELALRVPASLALRRRVLPFAEDAEALYAACADPQDLAALEALERFCGKRVVARRAEPASLERMLARVFGSSGVPRGADPADDAVRLLDELLRAALIEQASDIHLDPRAQGMRLRFRIDGELVLHRSLPPERVLGLVNRIKVLASLDIAERRRPQDGSFAWTYGRGDAPRRVDVRVAALPTRHGERLTLRLLLANDREADLPGLGMEEADLARFRRALARPHGLILLTGPTGSGKSTTLHAGLRELDRDALHVVTIEDPIEYELDGASQTEVGGSERVGFADALRSALRHDPDVVMVGEVRDLETAEVAVRAALTGHLVLSTLHTNSAVGAVTRLRDMGVPPYLVAATLRLSVAQRLVRRLCAGCASRRPLRPEEARALGAPERAGEAVGEPRGCVCCRHTGFTGRIGLFECAELGREAAEAVAAGRDEAELARVLARGGAADLRADALRKVLAGCVHPLDALAAAEEL